MTKLVLLDIDGTLIKCGKAPRNAIVRAMESVYGTKGGVDHYSFSGKTDPQIIYDVMVEARLNESMVRERIPQVLDEYVRHLDGTLRPEEITILNGIQKLLDSLRSNSGVILGLLTGNVLQGAKIKLSRAGIASYFFNGHEPVGAFGSDAMNRTELPPIAVQRARAAVGKEFKEKEIVIIGDSPYDVLCGRSLNVKSVGVATGWHSLEELEKHNPDYAFTDLSETESVVRAILS